MTLSRTQSPDAGVIYVALPQSDANDLQSVGVVQSRLVALCDSDASKGGLWVSAILSAAPQRTELKGHTRPYYQQRLALRQAMLEVKLAARRLSGPRMKPSIFVIGAQKAGTTSLFGHLDRHPQIMSPLVKEVHYFDLAVRRGDEWYGAHFPLERDRAIRSAACSLPVFTFDTTPYYIFHPDVAARIAAFAPDAKIIALLRDPVDRAWSHYWHEWGRGYEKLGPMDALAAEHQRLRSPHITAGTTPHELKMHQHFSYIARSEYDRQLARWFELFPRKNILCLKSERLFSEPDQVLVQIADFLGIEPFGKVAAKALNQGDYDAAPAPVRAWLSDRLAGSMSATAALLGAEMTW